MKGLILSKTCLWDIFFKNLRNSLLSNIYLYISIVAPFKAKYRCCIFLLLHKLFFLFLVTGILLTIISSAEKGVFNSVCVCVLPHSVRPRARIPPLLGVRTPCVSRYLVTCGGPFVSRQ